VGVLVNRSQLDASSSPLRSYSAISRDMSLAMSDSAVRAVVLDVDSPGGECAGCFELAEAIRGMRGRKPIVAVANGYAYSAAYAIASAAETVFVSRAGGVGSVGVVALHLDQSRRDEQQGLTYEYVFAGAKKVDGNSHQPLSDGARADLSAEVSRCYGIFAALVAANRGMPDAKVRATEAGCFYGETAVEAGLADRVGTLVDAVAEAARRADAGTSAGRGRGASNPRGMSSEGITMDENQQAAPDAAAEQTQGAPLAATTSSANLTLNVEDVAGIVELCALAGRPQDAAGFIRAGKTRGEVSEALLRGRASAQEQEPLTASHGVPGTAKATRGTNPADPHGWSASINRVCGTQKGA